MSIGIIEFYIFDFCQFIGIILGDLIFCGLFIDIFI